LVAAAVEAAQLEGRPIELSIVHGGNAPDVVAGSMVRVRSVQMETKHVPERFGSIKSFFRDKEMNAPLVRTLSKLAADFVYPVSILPSSLRVAWAEWIPDIQHCTHPEFFTSSELRLRDEKYREAAQQASCVVFSSSTVRTQFVEHGYKDVAPLAVLPFRVDISQSYVQQSPGDVLSKYSLPERYLLVCNQFWKHKNHRAIFHALREARGREPGLLVVCTGALRDYRDESYVDECLQQISRLGISSNVRLLGVLPKRDQLDLMRLACAVIQPSYSEGWSTIVEEARCLGARLLLSDLAVHREQGAPNSVFFDPNDPIELSELLLESHARGCDGPSPEELDVKWGEYRKLFTEFGSSFLGMSRGLSGRA
jgi:glycosyltransferase involved in cell wall biosynthesis